VGLVEGQDGVVVLILFLLFLLEGFAYFRNLGLYEGHIFF
jgi:hypothetical protein